MRSLWNGAICFGLVTIPVKLYAATQRRDVAFKQLHAVCRTPIRYQRTCPACAREVGADEIVPGYEVTEGQYVVLSEEDLAELPAPSRRSIDILDFVQAAEVDPIFFDRTYYLEPAEGGHKAYALLRRAMTDTGRLGLGRATMRARESLCAIRPYDERALAMQTMFFGDEVRPAAALAGLSPDAEVALDAREVEMAVRLVQNLSRPFDPRRYENRRRAALDELVQARAARGDLAAPVPAPDAASPVDLVEALRRSLQ